jgi:flavin reductase (DIM6/NTAB) family NADH-FMN oxidoreductase RutF
MDADRYRRLMGFWATGVSVVTARSGEGPAGATANALTSLSLEPPRALVCFDISSRTLHAVRESERFAVNVLAAGQEEVSRLFATKATQEEKFAAVACHDEHGAPVIEGCLAWFVCSLESELKTGDHVVAFGRVLAGGHLSEAEPLLYYRSAYLAFDPKPAL